MELNKCERDGVLDRTGGCLCFRCIEIRATAASGDYTPDTSTWHLFNSFLLNYRSIIANWRGIC
jgi:hypothetical protein